MVHYQSATAGRSSGRLFGYLLVCLVWGPGVIAFGYIALFAALFLVDVIDRAVTERFLHTLESGAAGAVPRGSDRDAAVSWLVAHKMRVSEWVEPEEVCRIATARGIPGDEVATIVRGETKQDVIEGRNEITVYFFLDQQGRVISHQIGCFRPSS